MHNIREKLPGRYCLFEHFIRIQIPDFSDKNLHLYCPWQEVNQCSSQQGFPIMHLHAISARVQGKKNNHPKPNKPQQLFTKWFLNFPIRFHFELTPGLAWLSRFFLKVPGFFKGSILSSWFVFVPFMAHSQKSTLSGIFINFFTNLYWRKETNQTKKPTPLCTCNTFRNLSF